MQISYQRNIENNLEAIKTNAMQNRNFTLENGSKLQRHELTLRPIDMLTEIPLDVVTYLVNTFFAQSQMN